MFHRAGGSQFWSVLGPVFVGVAANGGDLARGVYVIDGVYTLDLSATGHKHVTVAHGSYDDVRARVG